MKKIRKKDLSRELSFLDSLKTFVGVFIMLMVLAFLFFWSLPSYGQTNYKEYIENLPDSSYVIEGQTLYQMINGKKKSRANYYCRTSDLEMMEILVVIDTLIDNPGRVDSAATHILIKTEYKYDVNLWGLVYRYMYYRAVYEEKRKAKGLYRSIYIFQPEEANDLYMHWWYKWGLPVICLIGVLIILIVGFKIKDKHLDGHLFIFVFVSSFGFGLFMTGVSQVLMLDAWGVPENVAEVLVAHPPIYAMMSLLLLWVLYKAFLKKILIKLFN